MLTPKEEIAIEFDPRPSTSVPASDHPTSAVVRRAVAEDPGIDPEEEIAVPPESVSEAS
jgi:hypothetical protein